MRIMFVIPTLGTGGAERVASILANHLSENNKVEIYLLEKTSVKEYPIRKNIVIKEAMVKVKRGNKLRSISNYFFNFIQQRNELNKEIKNNNPDIVISFLPKADLLMYTLGTDESICWISSERNDPMSRNIFERMVLNYIYRRTSMLVCQTKVVSSYYKKHSIKNTTIIRNPLVLNGSFNSNIDLNDKFFISVGRLDKQKNFEMLIEAFSYAKRKKKFKEKLYILGNGPRESALRKLIFEKKMEEQIYLIGRKENVGDYLKKATAFLLSSNYEGLPNAMLEAMAAGLPIISTDFFTGAAREFVDSKNGVLIPVNDKYAMAKAIEDIISISQEERLNMGEISKERVKNLEANKIVKKWEKLIENCVDYRKSIN